MHWSWNHATDEVWRQLDADFREITHNPWVVLQKASRNRIERVLADPVFRKNVDGLVEARREAAETPAWFQRNHSDIPLTCVAYFSMEFMLSEALPVYSGCANTQGSTTSQAPQPMVSGQRLFEVEVYLHELDPSATRVELYADSVDGGGPVRQEMERVGQLAGASNGCTYRTRVSAARPATDYTARLIPSYTGGAVPLESSRILWR